ncbi:hypothetical protein DRO69_05230 [Candidatus Bathyarchaeota archaeon]|nr:MAG: hypothetical protein DRO69_05230 [Candidatus Bathyarchaeota archaeon]
MNTTKAQKEFVVVTLIALISIALIIAVYATLLGTFQGGNVTVVAVNGQVQYSLDNSTGWSTSLSNLPITDPWYVRFVTETGGYTGNVQITWELYNSTNDLIHSVTTTSFSLNGSQVQQIYASSDGSQSTNYNWGQNTTVADTYYIKVTFNTA